MIQLILIIGILVVVAWGISRVGGQSAAVGVLLFGVVIAVILVMPPALEPYFGWSRDLLGSARNLLG